MDPDRRSQIAAEFEIRETQDLIEIWRDFNPAEWEEGVLDILRGILIQRIGQLPPQSTQSQLDHLLNRINHFLQAGQFDMALSESNQAIQLAPHLANLL